MLSQPSRSPVIWLPVALALGALAWRVAKLGFGVHDPVPNFSPWLALAFAGGALMNRGLPAWVWPLVLVTVDAVCVPGDFSGTWSIYAIYAVAAFIGMKLRGSLGAFGIVFGTAALSVAFYIISSTQAWAVNPVYAKTLAGWFNALIVGDPAYQPQAWVFGVRSLISETLFALLLVAAYNAEATFRGSRKLPWWQAAAIPAV